MVKGLWHDMILWQKRAPQKVILLDNRQAADRLKLGGTNYLSNATCLIRPRLFYALFTVSRITIICKSIRHF